MRLSSSDSIGDHLKPAGIMRVGRDTINNEASVFLKQVDPEVSKLASTFFAHRRHSKSQP